MDATFKINQQNQLSRRGLSAVARANSWYSGVWRSPDNIPQTGWFQPLFDETGSPLLNPDTGKRVIGWKNADSHGTPHDAWLNYPRNAKPLLFGSHNTVEAIANAHGQLFLAEGKADTLSLWASGVLNAAGILGSGFLPDDLPERLHRLGVCTITFYSHPDQAGLRSAQRLVDLLRNALIVPTILKLPTTTDGHKCDVNDLWIESRFDPVTFQAGLEGLEKLDLRPTPIRTPPKRLEASQPVSDAHLRAYGQAALQRIAGDLCQVGKGDRNNAVFRAAAAAGSLVAANTLDEGEVEAVLLDATFGIGLRETEARTAIRSGIQRGKASPRDLSYLQERAISFKAAFQIEQSNALRLQAQWPQGLPDIWCSTLRKFFPPSIAPTIYLAVKAITTGIHSDNSPFDIATLVDYAVRLHIIPDTLEDRQQIAKMIRAGLGSVFFQKLDANNTCSFDTHPCVSKNTKKSGRPSQLYQLAPFSVMLDAILKCLPFRLIEQCFPGNGARTPVLADLAPEWFTGEIGFPAPDAERVVGLIKQHLKPNRDEEAEANAARRNQRLSRFLLKRLLNDGAVTPLPDGWHFRTPSEFVACRLRGLIEKMPGAQHSQYELAAFLGVAKSSLPTYRALAGVISEPCIEECPIAADTWEDTVRTFAREKKARPISIQAERDTKKRVAPFDVEKIVQLLRTGWSITVLFQAASRQCIAEEKQPEPMSKTSVAKPLTALEEVLLPSSAPAGGPSPRYFGAGFSQRWVIAQLVLWLRRSGYESYSVDRTITSQGEIVAEVCLEYLTLSELLCLAQGEALIDYSTYDDEQVGDNGDQPDGSTRDQRIFEAIYAKHHAP